VSFAGMIEPPLSSHSRTDSDENGIGINFFPVDSSTICIKTKQSTLRKD
jgi:hypothetical protein